MGNFFQEFWNDIVNTLQNFEFKDAIDIIIIALILFYLFRLFRRSRVGQLVKGIVFLLIAFAVASFLNLTMVSYILDSLFSAAVIIFVIIFQPELRQALERLGRSNKSLKNIVSTTSGTFDAETVIRKAIGDVADTCAVFSKSKTGALIVFERESMLGEIADTGTYLNCDISPAILGNIFFNKAPLHDGACIIRDGKVLAAGCILPLTDNQNVSQELGTRHRAAIGMSEGCDAVVVVVSEENGVISIALNGSLTRDYSRETLSDKLCELLLSGDRDHSNLFTALKIRKEKKNEKE